MFRRHRKAQLFIMEVIIAVSVLLILVTALFSTQNFSPPPEETNLGERISNAIESIIESGELYDYITSANTSFYVDGNSILDAGNQNKADVKNSILASLPAIASFKAFTLRFNETTQIWQRIDVVNYEIVLPSIGVELIEQYIPGFRGIFAQFRFQIYAWYEVGL